MKDIGIKMSLKLIVAFLCLGIVGTAVGACLYMMYSMCTMLVAGESLAAFSSVLFLKGVFASFPVVMLISSMLLILYFIRHPAKPVIPLFVYTIIIAAVWLFLIPFSELVSAKYNKAVEQPVVARTLSPGFFRHSNGCIVYYSKISKDNKGQGVCIDASDRNSESSLYTFSNVPLPSDKGKFSDSLIAETVAMPKLLESILKGYTILRAEAQKALPLGKSWWLCFASLGLALLSVIGLRRVTNWRLLNTFLVIFSTAGIVFFNALCYGTNSPFGKIPGIVNDWFKQTTFLHNPFVVVCNILLAFFFIILGLCIDIFKKNTELDEEGNPA